MSDHNPIEVTPGNASELWLVRKGHMGDVILTEPVARALRERYSRLVLVTQYVAIGRLLEAYDAVRGYTEEFVTAPPKNADRLVLTYEHRRDLHYLDAYADSARVSLPYRLPRLRGGDRRLIEGPYCLIAPYTSQWRREMRTWPERYFEDLSQTIQLRFDLQVVVLDGRYGFDEMLALIRHCRVFVGNDSGPAVIAQCYRRPAVVLFGATRAESVLVDSSAVGISQDVGCNGCLHHHGAVRLSCADPLCLRSLGVGTVLDAITRQLSLHSDIDVEAGRAQC
jgi:ADP-heptose:LPS heptosyltransferase